MKLWAKILNILFPNKCISCNKIGKSLCMECLHKIQRSSENNKSIHSLYSYKNIFIKKLLLEFKYKNRRSIVEDLSPIIVDELIEILSEKYAFINTENILITGIPMSFKRLKNRSINHSEIIAKEISRESNKRGSFIKYKQILGKKFETTPQAKIKNKQNRLENIKGSFYYLGNKKNMSSIIIVIDDISTTGATLFEAKKCLEKNGFKNIILFSIAH